MEFNKEATSASSGLVYVCFGSFVKWSSRGGHLSPQKKKLEKIWFFGVKSWFFTRNTPTNFAPPFARRNFFKCASLTWNPGSAPGLDVILCWSYVQSTDRHVASIGLVILIPYPFCKLSGKVVFVFNWSRNELAVFEVIINYSHWDVDLIDKTLLNIFDFFFTFRK